MSSIRFTCFMFMVFLFCIINVFCPFALSVLAMKESMLKVPSTTSLRVNKGLLAQNEVGGDFSENGSEEGGTITKKMGNLLGDDDKVSGKKSGVPEGDDEKHPGFTGHTMKVGLDVRHRVRLRNKQKGKGVIIEGRHLATPSSQNLHGGSTDAEKEEMMNLMHRDYRYVARHPPPINN